MNDPDKGPLRGTESRTFELKRDLSSLAPILRTLVAFANTAGGTLVVGREDDGRIVGVTDPEREVERLASAITDGIRPLLIPDIEIVEHDGKHLIVVRVAWWTGPFWLKAKGPEAGVYVRLGTTNRQADATTLEHLQNAPSSRAFDQLPCVGARMEDLDLDLVRSRFYAVGRTLDEAKLDGLGIVVQYGHERVPSNGGIILFGRPVARERFFPDAQVRCARFVGPDKAQFLDRLDIESSVLEAIPEVERFVRRNTRLASRIESWVRQDIPEYPRLALREAVVNAVAHADYSQRGMQIMVAVFSEHLEVQSPGPLPLGITLVDFKNGLSRIRNPVIARVLRELDLMEKWGSGYRRVCEDCESGGYPIPDWSEQGPVIRVSFKPHPATMEPVVKGADVHDDHEDVHDDHEDVHDPVAGKKLGEDASSLNERQLWFLSRLRAGSDVHLSDIMERFKVSMKTAHRDATGLRILGLVDFVGPARTGRYMPRPPSEDQK